MKGFSMARHVTAHMTCKNVVHKKLKDCRYLPIGYIIGTCGDQPMETLLYILAIGITIGANISVIRYEIKATKRRPTKPLY